MVTAYGCFRSAQEKAFRCRMVALRAAKSGRNILAIKLTELAQKNDQLAESWHKHVPEYQWKVGLEYDEKNRK